MGYSQLDDFLYTLCPCGPALVTTVHLTCSATPKSLHITRMHLPRIALKSGYDFSCFYGRWAAYLTLERRVEHRFTTPFIKPFGIMSPCTQRILPALTCWRRSLCLRSERRAPTPSAVPLWSARSTPVLLSPAFPSCSIAQAVNSIMHELDASAG
jgi:hypothetical protein